jgi:hypothetical protein
MQSSDRPVRNVLVSRQNVLRAVLCATDNVTNGNGAGTEGAVPAPQRGVLCTKPCAFATNGNGLFRSQAHLQQIKASLQQMATGAGTVSAPFFWNVPNGTKSPIGVGKSGGSFPRTTYKSPA